MAKRGERQGKSFKKTEIGEKWFRGESERKYGNSCNR
jgi:hypothetical protein